MINSTKNFQELIEYEEFNAISWDDRLLGCKSKIQTTKEVASVLNGSISFPAETIFLPNKFSKITLVVFTIIILAILLGMILKEIFLRNTYSTGLLFFACLSILLLWITVNNIKNKEVNYEIKLTKQGIEIQGSFYKWQDVVETYIIWRPQGKGGTYFLLIGLSNGIFSRYNINNFMGFIKEIDKEIAKAIEYYKAQAQNPTPPPFPASTISTQHIP